jgi:hypothetical protein
MRGRSRRPPPPPPMRPPPPPPPPAQHRQRSHRQEQQKPVSTRVTETAHIISHTTTLVLSLCADSRHARRRRRIRSWLQPRAVQRSAGTGTRQTARQWTPQMREQRLGVQLGLPPVSASAVCSLPPSALLLLLCSALPQPLWQKSPRLGLLLLLFSFDPSQLPSAQANRQQAPHIDGHALESQRRELAHLSHASEREQRSKRRESFENFLTSGSVVCVCKTSTADGVSHRRPRGR